MDFIDKSLESRQLSQNSIKLYKHNLLKLNDNKPNKSFHYLKNMEDILDKIKELKPTTECSYIKSIWSVLRDIPKYKKLYDEYFELLKKYNNDLKVNTDKSENQEKNWISQEEVFEVHQKLKEDEKELLNKKRKIDKSTFHKLLHYMILSLYTLISPRRNKDYSLMEVSSDRNDDNYNYLVMDKKKNFKFVLNKYKTDKNTIPLK